MAPCRLKQITVYCTPNKVISPSEHMAMITSIECIMVERLVGITKLNVSKISWQGWPALIVDLQVTHQQSSYDQFIRLFLSIYMCQVMQLLDHPTTMSEFTFLKQ